MHAALDFPQPYTDRSGYGDGLEPIGRDRSFGWSNGAGGADVHHSVGNLVFGNTTGSITSRVMPSIPVKPAKGVSRSHTARSRTRSYTATTNGRVASLEKRLAMTHDKRLFAYKNKHFIDPELTMEQQKVLNLYQEKASENDNLRIELEVLSRHKLAALESGGWAGGPDVTEDYEKLKSYVKTLLEENEVLNRTADNAVLETRNKVEDIKDLKIKLGVAENMHKGCDETKHRLEASKADLRERLDELRAQDKKWKEAKEKLEDLTEQTRIRAEEFESKHEVETLERKRMEVRWKGAKSKLSKMTQELESARYTITNSVQTINKFRQDIADFRDSEMKLNLHAKKMKTLATEKHVIAEKLAKEIDEVKQEEEVLKKLIEDKSERLRVTIEKAKKMDTQQNDTISRLVLEKTKLSDGLKEEIKKYEKWYKEALELADLVTELTGKVNMRSEKIERLELELNVRKRKIQTLVDSSSDLTKTKFKLELEVSNIKRKFDSKKQQFEKVAAALKDKSRTVNELQSALKQHSSEFEELQVNLQRVKNKHKNSAKAIDKLEKENAAYKATVVSQTSQLCELRETNAANEKTLIKQTTDIADLIERDSQDTIRIRSQATTIRAQEERLKQLDNLRVRTDELEALCKLQSLHLDDQRINIEDLTEECRLVKEEKVKLERTNISQEKAMDILKDQLAKEKENLRIVSELLQKRDAEIVTSKTQFQELRVKTIKLKTQNRRIQKQVSSCTCGAVAVAKATAASAPGTTGAVGATVEQSTASLMYELKAKTMQVKTLRVQLETMVNSSKEEMQLNKDLMVAKDAKYSAENFRLRSKLGEGKERVYTLRQMVDEKEDEIAEQKQKVVDMQTEHDRLRTQVNLMRLKKSTIWDKSQSNLQASNEKLKENFVTVQALYEHKKEEITKLKQWKVHVLALNSLLTKKLKLGMGSTSIHKEDLINVILEKDNAFFDRLIHVPNQLAVEPDSEDEEETESLSAELELAKRRELLVRKELNATNLKHISLKQSVDLDGEHKMQLDQMVDRDNRYDKSIKDAEVRLRQMKAEAGLKFDMKKEMRGLRVLAVLEGRAAEDAGIKRNDVIEEVSQLKITNFYEYEEALMMARPGQTVLFRVRREHLVINVLLVMGAEEYTPQQTKATLRLAATHRTDHEMDFTKNITENT